MSKINLYRDKQDLSTSVSNIFIDEYMSAANGEFVKIYLYLLRQLNSTEAKFSISEIADKFEHTEKDIKRALNYWERMQLLHLEYDSDKNLTGIQLLDAPSREQSALVPSPVISEAPAKKVYSADKLKQFREQEAIAELLFIAEQYLGRPLTLTDMNTIYYWHNDLSLSPELIEYLIEYSVSNGHSSMHYMDKIALSWNEKQIHTVEEAKLASGQYNQTYTAVMKAFGITKRSLVSSEIAYIDKWKNDYGFTTDMILAACDKTIHSTHEPSFQYANKILTDWKDAGVRTLPDVIKADSVRQNRKKAAAIAKKAAGNNAFNNFDQRSYDSNQLEKMLLTTSVQ